MLSDFYFSDPLEMYSNIQYSWQAQMQCVYQLPWKLFLVSHFLSIPAFLMLSLTSPGTTMNK